MWFKRMKARCKCWEWKFGKALEAVGVEGGQTGCASILGSWKCKPPFLRLIVQKKSLVLQFSLQNGVIVQQHQHLLTMESAYFPLFFYYQQNLNYSLPATFCLHLQCNKFLVSLCNLHLKQCWALTMGIIDSLKKLEQHLFQGKWGWRGVHVHMPSIKMFHLSTSTHLSVLYWATHFQVRNPVQLF